ncbi:MAG: CPBP family intramembrane metalloprotease [Clostridia bacterium]|nr:CPBP family intramembrane metalloprotease [Clostridia bacterium]
MSGNKYELRKQMKSVRWMIFWVVLAQFAAQIAVEAVVSFMSNPPHEYIRIAVLEIISIGVPIMVYAKTVWNGNGRKIKQEMCLQRCNPGFALLAAILGITGQFVMMILNVPANYILSAFQGTDATNSVAVAVEWYEVILGIFAVVIIPAILEEFWMRGIIFSAYNRCNTKAAVFFTALIFALLHLRINEFAGFFFMGIMASLVLIKSGSIYGAMIYHAFSNLTALLFGAHIMPKIIDYIWLSFAVMVIIFIITLIILLKQKSRMNNNKVFNSASLVITSIFSMPVLVSVAVVVLKYFLLNMAG